MSFSKLARIGYGYNTKAKTPRRSKAKKKQIAQDKAARILTERINTVYEETDESFVD